MESKEKGADMALYWPEACVAVTSAEAMGAEEWPSEVIVVLLRPGQEDDPSFVETVRELVRERALERRRDSLEQLWEVCRGLGEVRGGELRGDEEATDAQRAEARLRELVCAGERDEPQWRDHEADLGGYEDVLAWGPMDWRLAGPERQVIVGRCERLVVRD